jgi:hypothetical protein
MTNFGYRVTGTVTLADGTLTRLLAVVRIVEVNGELTRVVDRLEFKPIGR